MATMRAWIEAARPRTLPLALASIGMGAFLAASADAFQPWVFVLSVLTTLFLQVLSNLANDYGDFVHGADSIHREGPSRAVQSGKISPKAMKRAMVLLAILSFVSGMALLLTALSLNLPVFLAFLGLGLAAIWAAITYTSGRKPYGYAGLGDLFVLLFFGIVGVLGSFYLHTRTLPGVYLLPALSCGLFSTGVLNLNNIRDLRTDQLAGKKSIPVRLGRQKAVLYHWGLLLVGLLASVCFVAFTFHHCWQWLFLVTVPLFIRNAQAVQRYKNEPAALDPYLKQLALSTLLYVLTFGMGHLLSS